MDHSQFRFAHWDFDIASVGRGEIARELHQREAWIALSIRTPLFTKASKVSQSQIQIILAILPHSIYDALVHPVAVKHWLFDVERETVLHVRRPMRIDEGDTDIRVIHGVPRVICVEPSNTHPALGLGTQSDVYLLIDKIRSIESGEVRTQLLVCCITPAHPKDRIDDDHILSGCDGIIKSFDIVILPCRNRLLGETCVRYIDHAVAPGIVQHTSVVEDDFTSIPFAAFGLQVGKESWIGAQYTKNIIIRQWYDASNEVIDDILESSIDLSGLDEERGSMS
jgi:hypothetical protein